MRFLATRRTTASLFFIIGMLFMFVGCAFLFSFRSDTSLAQVLIALFFVLLGVSSAIYAIKLHKRSLYLFFAVTFLQVGLFLLLATLKVIPLAFSEAWPLLSIFSGLALFPAGWHRYGSIRANYLVPSIAFVVLGSILMVFSLDIVTFSLAQFVKDWWPLLLALGGLILVFVSISTIPKSSGDAKK